MIPINGENYYIDVDVLNDILYADSASSDETFEDKRKTENFDENGDSQGYVVDTSSIYKPREVDAFKYEMYMSLIGAVLMAPMEREDGMLPLNFNDATINFTIAFNTLLFKKIIKKL